MNLVLMFDRVVNKIRRSYRRYVFRKRINCPHKQFNLVGDVHLINTNITLGRNTLICPGVVFFGDGPIVIGDNVAIGDNTLIYASQKGGGVTIGDNAMVAAQSYIIDTNHGYQAGQLIRLQEMESEPIVIGKDVWIAANVTILKGSRIGDGAVVGAKALVNGNIPENAIAVGIPAKTVQYRK